jgi:hypothetical protein
MLTEKDYCDYDTCVALKELGMKGYAHPFVNVPKIHLYSAQKWLREEKKIEVVILGENEIGGPYCADIYTEGGYAGYVHKTCVKYEEALLEGIKEAVKLLINNKNE